MGVDIDKLRQDYDTATTKNAPYSGPRETHREVIDRLLESQAAHARAFAAIPDVLAELTASRQRVSELEDQRDEAHGGVSRQRMELADMRAELAKRDKSIVRLSAELVVLRDTLASREAALREIRDMPGVIMAPAHAAQWMRDRAAQEVGR